MKTIIISIALTLVAGNLLFADTHYVNVNNSSGAASPYTTWATAATDIQSAVDAAISGDSVLVTNGIYDTGERITQWYSSSNRVVIIKDITVRSVNGPKDTIILGKGPQGSNAVRGVYMTAGILSGFTVSNGHTWTKLSGHPYYDQSGGGVNMYDGGIITNCIISGNEANYYSGGTYKGTVNNCIIIGNSSSYCGGGTAYGIVNNCTISGNSAGYKGIYSYGGGTYDGIVNNCTIIGNSAGDAGGGAYQSTINNCTISGNSAGNNGGGAGWATINNCTISGNSADDSGGGTYYGTITNSIIWNNFAPVNLNYYYGTFRYSCTSPLPAGEGNFSTNPILVSASHISPTSPCIGAGNNASAAGTDIDGELWKNPPSVGCDEVYTNDLTGDLLVDIYAKNTTAVVGVSLEFEGLITGKPVSNLWSFGDGSFDENNYISKHSFSAAGEYKVIFSAFNLSNPDGVSATVSVSIIELGDAIYYVNKSNPTPAYPYRSWATAATKIQDAVDASLIHSQVIVTNGIYDVGETVTPGYSSLNRVVITKDITVRSVNGPETTIIIGKGPQGNNAVRGVYMSAGVLEGFTVSNGHTLTSGDWNYDQSGGGINMHGGNGIVTNCIISENSSSGNGGGTFYGTVNNCMIKGNSAGSGGGVHTATANNCTISGNSADWMGGGTYGCTANNCTISGNSAGIDGGGDYYSTLNNCIIWDNSAPSGENFSGSTIRYSCTSPLPEGEGNFSANPLLVSASHISPDSPCIGAGANIYATGTDIDGELWKNPPSVGCDEFYTNNLTGDLLIDIYAKYTVAIVGVSLDFKGLITGKPISNCWSFGDGSFDANNYISKHSFSSAGEYKVIFSAFNLSNPGGVSATVTVNVVELDVATFYVNKSNLSPAYPYKSWSTAATKIQHAVDAATLIYSQVIVTNGIYDVDVNVTPGYSSSNRVVITKNIIVKSVNGPENTIIIGKGPRGSNAVRGVYMTTGILEGFTVSNGHTLINGDWSYDQNGGGINIINENAIVTNCIICNGAADWGGGVAGGTINNCTISGNSARIGGGITDGIANNCTISDNTAEYGGAIYEGSAKNCTISENSAKYSGGGVSACNLIDNCMIIGNLAGNNGGGADWSVLNNCTIIGNTATNSGGGTYYGTVNNCIIWDNFAATSNNFYGDEISYSCSTPLPSGTGNISYNPQFVSSSDFHLQTNSPCINAGTNAFAPMPYDLDGNPRILDGIVDMGCYEANSNPPADEFADANPLPNNEGVAAGSNTNAPTEPGEPQHAGNGGPYHSVWWDWSEPASTMAIESAAGDILLVDTHGSDFDTVLAVYTGPTVSNLTQIAANDDTGPGIITSEVTFHFNSGETYHIAVDGKTDSDTGNVVLNYAVIPEPIGIWILGLMGSWILVKRGKL